MDFCFSSWTRPRNRYYAPRPKPAASGKDAIKASENLQTHQEKVDYLVKEAKCMYKKEMFHDAVEVCKHILQSLDKKSKEAKTLLEDALKELGSLGKEILEGVKKKYW